jgi:hypothetical protein
MQLVNPPGLIRDDVHLAIGFPAVDVDGPVLRCPACRWEQATSAEGQTGTTHAG